MELIFVHIPKTAGCSIRKVHSDNNHGHATSAAIRKKIGQEAWKKAYKFAVIRNPYDRLVSLFFYFKQFKPGDHWYRHNKKIIAQVQAFDDFKDFVLKLKDFKFLENYHFQPQWTFLDHTVDQLIPMENLDEVWAELAQRFGLPQELPAKNKTDHKPWQDYYSNAMKEVVREVYAIDFEKLGYER